MKRLFFFSGHGLTAYEWDKNQYLSRYEFLATEVDKDRFKLFLRQQPTVPSQILVDVIEEEFSRDHIPYVTGADRRALLTRTKTKKFRSNKYSYIELQGRQKEGRKDLNVLVSALLNPKNLEYWLEQIQESQIPIEGIYSLPIVGGLLTPIIGELSSPKHNANKGKVLIISQQGSATLRQSYYIDGQLVQSRLSAVNDEEGMDYVYLLENEISKTIRFLESARVYKRQDEIAVFVIVPSLLEGMVREHIHQQKTLTYSIVSTEKILSKVGMKGDPVSSYADILYGQLLLGKTFYKNQYAPIKQCSGYYHLLIGKGLNVASVVVFIGLILFCAVSLLDWFEKTALIDTSNNDIVQYQRRLNNKQKELTTYTYSATTTKNVVELFDNVKKKTYTEPKQLFAILSTALRENTNILTTTLTWEVTTKINKNVTEKIESVFGEPLAFQKKDYLVLNLVGKVVAFDDDYRLAIQYHQKFLSDLRALPKVIEVSDVLSPFNLNSASTIVGDSGTSAQVTRKSNATFKLKLVMDLR